MDFTADDFLMMDAFAGILFGVFAFGFLFCIAIYVVSALGWYKFFKTMGGEYEQNAWMAWIPYCNQYIAGKFLEEQMGLPTWFRWLATFYPFLSFIPLIGSLVVLAASIYIIVVWCQYMSKINAPGYLYVIYFLVGIIYPYLLNSYVIKANIGDLRATNSQTNDYNNYNTNQYTDTTYSTPDYSAPDYSNVVNDNVVTSADELNNSENGTDIENDF